MQMTKEAKAYQKSAWIIRLVFLLAGLMIAGGGIWYVAITGIIGRKSWDFGKYGLPPAILAAAGGVVLLEERVGILVNMDCRRQSWQQQEELFSWPQSLHISKCPASVTKQRPS